MLSVTPDLTASASYQAAPQKPALPDPSPATNSFAALVNSTSHVSSTSVPAPEPPASPRLAGTDAPKPPSNTASSHSNASGQPAALSGATDSAVHSGAPAPTSLGEGKSGGNGSRVTSGPKSVTSTSSGGRSADKTAADSAAATDAISTTQIEGTTTPAATVIAVATVLPVGPQPVAAEAPPAAIANSTPPLAIAAAAIAASSSAAAALAPPYQPSKAGAATAATATTIGTPAKIAGQATTQAPTATSPNVSTDLATAVDVAPSAATLAPDRAKGKTATGFLAPPSGQAKVTTTGFTGAPDPAAATTTTTTTTAAARDSTAQQPNGDGKADAGNAPVTPASSNTAPSAPNTTTPAPALRNHVAIDASPPASTTVADASAQGAAVAQQQPWSAVPATAAPVFTVTPATGAPVPVSALGVEIAASVQSGKTRFEVRLDPPDLGRIDVRIDVDRNGQVTSHLTVEKPETLSMLRQDAPQLQQALNDAGLKTGSGGLQFSLRDQSSSGQNSGNQTNGNSQQLVIDEDDSVATAVAGQSYGRMLGANGGIDIRV